MFISGACQRRSKGLIDKEVIMLKTRLLGIGMMITLAATAVIAQNESSPSRLPDVPYVPTSQTVVNAMLELAKVGKTDVLYDLGSGDGRIPITAASRHGARGVGIDINPSLVEQAKKNAEEAKVSDKVKFTTGDLFDFDFSEATVVTLYLLPNINLKLRPILWEQLKPGTRIVSHAFSMGDWKPQETRIVDGATIYFWTIPTKEEQKKLLAVPAETGTR